MKIETASYKSNEILELSTVIPVISVPECQIIQENLSKCE